MASRAWLQYGVSFLLLAGVGVVAYVTRDSWKPRVQAFFDSGASAKPAAAVDEHAGHDHGTGDRIKLSEQAQKNLKLVVDPLVPEKYVRSITIPGMVVDRPGVSDRGVSTPVAGVVTSVAVQPGDTVQPGDLLFKVRLLSELFQNSQSELFKATKELQLNKENLDRLKAIPEGALPQSRVIELENVDRRFKASISAYRQELLTRGLKPEQVDEVAGGKFITEISIVAPIRAEDAKENRDPNLKLTSSTGAPEGPRPYEVKDLKIQLGEQVQAGSVLCSLASHQLLYIEGRAFKQEAGLLEKAAQSGWPVKAEFAEEANGWPSVEEGLKIRHIANSVEPVSRTFGFFLSLNNQSRSYVSDGQTFLVWRFRPGQRVRLLVPIQQYEDVFVLPSDAVVREGAEVYAFRQNGDFFERKPVHLLLEDRETVLIANDGSVGPGMFVVRNAAGAINRAIKAQAGGGGGGHEGHNH